jgi:hypothetical protein
MRLMNGGFMLSIDILQNAANPHQIGQAGAVSDLDSNSTTKSP